MNKRDYYEVLGIEKSATDAEIKSAFRRLAKQYHPDVNKEPDAEAKFKEIQEAYAVLSDENRRKQYDQFGHAAFDGTGGAGGFGGFDASGFDFSDIFESIFGNSFGFGGRGASNRSTRGADKLMRIRLTFEEAVFGCEKEINLDVNSTCPECDGKGGFNESTCDACHGSGTVTSEQRTMFGTFMTKTTCPKCGGLGKSYKEECSKCRGRGTIRENKNLTVTIPSGVDHGNRLRLSGKGEAGNNGGPNGDLYLEFVVEGHKFYERDGDDIYLEVPLTFTEAILGCKKEIPTLYGNIKLTVPDGTNTGDKQRIRGKGVDNASNYRKGDMYVIFKVKNPKKLSRTQKDLLNKLNETDLDDTEIKNFKDFVGKN